jgi:hypothetical protein
MKIADPYRISLFSHQAYATLEVAMKPFFSFSRMRYFFPAVALALFASPLLPGQEAPSHLANATVLVIRHAEKPAKGATLTPEGTVRAEKYARYFSPFVSDGISIKINALYAGSDSAESVRPRLTLEPLSRASGVALNTQFSTGEPEKLAAALAAEPHGDHVLIAWRHKKIPLLLTTLGADSAHLLPDGTWPDSVYDWVVFLHFDAAGRLDQQKLTHEPNPLP